MLKKQVGFIGWRGMVGSVLIQRMTQEQDFNRFNSVFFSTSQKGQIAPEVINGNAILQDAYDMKLLTEMNVLVTCQGSEYSQRVLPQLRKLGWKGFWIDAASYYRMEQESMIVLDPINRKKIDAALNSGIKNYIGSNCTVSLMMLAIQGLINADLINWISVMSYQAVSGAGANAMQELLQQTAILDRDVVATGDILETEKAIRLKSQSEAFPCMNFMTAMAFNVLPFIDTVLPNGQSKEEWKIQAELNKILTRADLIAIDGICVRVPVLRAHSQALTIELKKTVSLREIETLLSSANPWVRFVENTPQETAKYLTPMAVTDTLNISVGRVKRTNLSNRHIQLFTVGDQLLWGAAEPLRRMLNICVME